MEEAFVKLHNRNIILFTYPILMKLFSSGKSVLHFVSKSLREKIQKLNPFSSDLSLFLYRTTFIARSPAWTSCWTDWPPSSRTPSERTAHASSSPTSPASTPSSLPCCGRSLLRATAKRPNFRRWARPRSWSTCRGRRCGGSS